jgi:uncharacterized membrane protein HdeD (DUF308 family)
MKNIKFISIVAMVSCIIVILLSLISSIIPDNDKRIITIALICLASVLNFISGVRQFKNENKGTGKFILASSVFIFIVGLIILINPKF